MLETMTMPARRKDTGRLLSRLETTLLAMLEFDVPAMREELGESHELVGLLRMTCLDGLAMVDQVREEGL